MASVKPISLSDLNGISLNPTDLATDELVGYVGYVRNLCSDLGTKNDSVEGWQDWVNFKNEIDTATISVFTPDQIDDNHTFDSMDLTGDNLDIPDIPLTMFAMYQGSLLYSYAMNGGAGVTPFDYSGNPEYISNDSLGLTPFDLAGGTPIQVNQSEEIVLTA